MLREIETFLAAARYGTFTEAGQRIGLTQSAVSEQIRRLEDYLGYRLFFRTGRSATLNADGQDLIPLADQVVALVAEMRRRDSVSEIRTTLRVGTVASLHSGLIARTMLTFHRVFPKVTLRSTRGEDDLLGQVEREELDLAVVIQPSGDLPGNVLWHPLLTKPFVLIAPLGIEAADWRGAMAGRPLLRYDHSTISGRQIDTFLGRTGTVAADNIWINYLDTMIALVGEGMGVALIPDSDLGPAADRIRVFPLGADTFHRHVGVLARRNGTSREAEAFLALLQDEARREIGTCI
ncbi:LysR family transcriptional regulator [Azorhizobium oxalatiphilum]|uniref:LysR family transcriptional regulator n=1 Tax=Azorhizobium oxalatiphilum TaxID=980631 RepID=A0A917C1Y6_9HYPH|nr:LysR family transcriptional regulator [Azorhizobium oxalatiphilum]GGF68005.1 LysR family transcriptional regulator [Azorhizobium oxalatiphilum]